MNLQGKHKIELNFSGNHTYLNYWDWAHGNDVTAEIVGDKLVQTIYDENGDEIGTEEINFQDFLEKVKESIKKINV